MSDSRLKVNEIFTSVQGEGVLAGEVMVFVRFSGCNLACAFCDTPASRGKSAFTLFERRELFLTVREELRKRECTRVCLTGGEPTIQPERSMELLVRDLHQLNGAGRPVRVSVETNGSSQPGWLHLADWVTVSPKPLVDTEALYRDYSYAEELKVVLAPDEEPPKFFGVLPNRRLLMPLTMQPFYENLEFNRRSYEWAASCVVRSGGAWRLSPRLQEIASVR